MDENRISDNAINLTLVDRMVRSVEGDEMGLMKQNNFSDLLVFNDQPKRQLKDPNTI